VQPVKNVNVAKKLTLTNGEMLVGLNVQIYQMRWVDSFIVPNVLRLCVCYFGLQTLAFNDKFYSQNNSTKPLLVDGAVN